MELFPSSGHVPGKDDLQASWSSTRSIEFGGGCRSYAFLVAWRMWLVITKKKPLKTIEEGHPIFVIFCQSWKDFTFVVAIFVCLQYDCRFEFCSKISNNLLPKHAKKNMQKPECINAIFHHTYIYSPNRYINYILYICASFSTNKTWCSFGFQQTSSVPNALHFFPFWVPHSLGE